MRAPSRLAPEGGFRAGVASVARNPVGLPPGGRDTIPVEAFGAARHGGVRLVEVPQQGKRLRSWSPPTRRDSAAVGLDLLPNGDPCAVDFVEQAKHFVECGTVVVDVGVQQTAGHIVECVEVLRQIAAGFKVKAGAQAVEDDVDGLAIAVPCAMSPASTPARAMTTACRAPSKSRTMS